MGNVCTWFDTLCISGGMQGVSFRDCMVFFVGWGEQKGYIMGNVGG